MNKSKLIKLLRENLILIIRPFVKPDNNLVIYKGFSGCYSDNPKYIAKKMHELHPEVKQYWDLGNRKSNKGNREIDSFIVPIYSNDIKYAYYINKAKVLVDNYTGYFLSEHPTKHDFKMKNKKQFNLSTNHGKAFKKEGNEALNCNNDYSIHFSSSDLLIDGNKHSARQMYLSYTIKYQNELPILLTGTPRTDPSFNITKDRIIETRKKLNLPIDKKIVLYAPTFRNDVNQSGPAQLKDLNVDKLLDTLGRKFGGEWIFVYRVHHVVEGIINKETTDSRIYNGNTHDDMEDYIVASNCLITDYSCSVFDFIYTKNPIFLYALDYDEYVNKERGLCFEIEKTPFSFANSSNELIKNIIDFDQKAYEKKSKEFLEKLGEVEDGKASERVVEIIYNKLKEDTK